MVKKYIDQLSVSCQAIPVVGFLAVAFLLSLFVNWKGTFAYIDKTALPILMFENPHDTKELRRVMLALRQEVYEQYKSFGSDNVVITSYYKDDHTPPSRLVPIDLSNGKKQIQSEVIDDLRGLLLLHPYDEVNAIRALSQMNPRKLDFNPHIFQYGGVFLYALGFWLLVCAKLGLYVLQSDIAFYLAQPNEMARLYMSGQLMIGFAVALGVIPLYFLGKIWRGKSAGVIASFLYCLVPLFLAHSHRLKPHGVVLPFALMAIYFIFSAQLKPSFKRYVIAGLFTGFGIGMIYTTGFLLFVLMANLSVMVYRRMISVRTAGASLLAVVCGFFIFNPYYLITPNEPIAELVLLLQTHVSSDGFWPKVLRYFYSELPAGMGMGLLVLFLCGLLTARIEKKPGDALLYFATAISMVATMFHRADAYHSIVTFGLGLLWVGVFVQKWVLQEKKLWAIGLLLAAVIIGFLQQSLYLSFFGQKDPSQSLGQWVHENVPASTRIVVVSDEGAHFGLPFRQWNYDVVHPYVYFEPKNGGLPKALEGKVNPSMLTSQAPVMLFASYSVLPERFELHGQAYALAAKFQRNSILYQARLSFLLNAKLYSHFNVIHYAYLPVAPKHDS